MAGVFSKTIKTQIEAVRNDGKVTVEYIDTTNNEPAKFNIMAHNPERAFLPTIWFALNEGQKVVCFEWLNKKMCEMLNVPTMPLTFTSKFSKNFYIENDINFHMFKKRFGYVFLVDYLERLMNYKYNLENNMYEKIKDLDIKDLTNEEVFHIFPLIPLDKYGEEIGLMSKADKVQYYSYLTQPSMVSLLERNEILRDIMTNAVSWTACTDFIVQSMIDTVDNTSNRIKEDIEKLKSESTIPVMARMSNKRYCDFAREDERFKNKFEEYKNSLLKQYEIILREQKNDLVK